MTKWVYNFGAGRNEGGAEMRNLLGGKGANLAEMASIGLPVPPGFTITTEVCTAFYENNRQYPADLPAQVRRRLAHIEKAQGLSFGDRHKPLLVSVRSGARVSMPGMMDTVLNLGLNDETVEGLAAMSRRRALRLGLLSPLHPDVRRRGARRRSSPVRGNHRARQAGARRHRGHRADRRGLAGAWWPATRKWSPSETGKPFPQDPRGAALGRHRRRVRQLG